MPDNTICKPEIPEIKSSIDRFIERAKKDAVAYLGYDPFDPDADIRCSC